MGTPQSTAHPEYDGNPSESWHNPLHSSDVQHRTAIMVLEPLLQFRLVKKAGCQLNLSHYDKTMHTSYMQYGSR